MSEYVGQEKVKEMLDIYKRGKKQKRSAGPCALYTAPGLGKTTLANIIANELNVNIRITSGPAIEKPGDLAAILTNLSPMMFYSLTKSTA